MGTVWAGRDELLGRAVAVKEVIPPTELTAEQRESMRERTLREARAAARINSSAAVTVYDVVEEDGRPWIVMEQLHARTLAEVIREEGPLPTGRAAQIGVRLLDALDAAHAAGVLHRDVKPGNVMLGEDGRVVLTDFGIASLEGDPSLTATGMLIGSPAYMAPERARGRPASRATDLWSLGATLYTAVEGRSPFERDGQLPTLTAVISEEPHPPRFAGPLWPVLEGLLHKDPDERTDARTARNLLSAAAGRAFRPVAASAPVPDEDLEHTAAFAVPMLAEAEAPQPPSAPPVRAEPPPPVTGSAPPPVTGPADPPVTGPADPPRRRHPAVVPLLAFLVACVVGVGGFWLANRDGAVDTAGIGTPRDEPAPVTTGTPSASAATAAVDAQEPDTAAEPTPAEQPEADREPSPPPPAADPSGDGGDGEDAGGQADEADTADVPEGFRRYEDSTGFSLAIPQGWEAGTDNGRRVFREPGGRSYLLVEQTNQPKDDAAATWEQNEGSTSQRLAGYERIRIEPVQFREWDNAADWEFTWEPESGPLHVLNRGFVTSDEQAYALYWSVPAEEWDESLDTFDVFAETFEPAG